MHIQMENWATDAGGEEQTRCVSVRPAAVRGIQWELNEFDRKKAARACDKHGEQRETAQKMGQCTEQNQKYKGAAVVVWRMKSAVVKV